MQMVRIILLMVFVVVLIFFVRLIRIRPFPKNHKHGDIRPRFKRNSFKTLWPIISYIEPSLSDWFDNEQQIILCIQS